MSEIEQKTTQLLTRKVILTGDRPTGRLHLGHYVGSLKSRIDFQEEHDQYIIIADMQALTDNFENSGTVADNVFEVTLDYLAVGLDPQKNTIFIQSCIPALSELYNLFMNIVTMARLERNPTVKEEIRNKYLNKGIPAGFFCYPVSQVADITAFGTDIVPVGNDQLPMIEQSNEIVYKFNQLYGSGALKEVKAFLSKNPRLPGIDGVKKMGKSLGNAIYLSDEDDEIRDKVNSMYTDANHLRVSDPGNVDNNVVFMYLDVFYKDEEHLACLKSDYQKGGLGDVTLKKLLTRVLIDLIGPIRERRRSLSKSDLMDILKNGTAKASKVAQNTLEEVKGRMRMNYF
jgi:tryptophanyl-tRNA synthetase